jgi:hypothetical protein
MLANLYALNPNEQHDRLRNTKIMYAFLKNQKEFDLPAPI